MALPQGSSLSPVCFNAYSACIAAQQTPPTTKILTFADDVVILVRSERAGQRVLASIARFLERRLKLTINKEKSHVVATDQLSFLAFSFRGTKIC